MKLASRFTPHVCIGVAAVLAGGLVWWKVVLIIFVVGLSNLGGFIERDYRESSR